LRDWHADSLSLQATSRLQDLEPTRQQVRVFLARFDVDAHTLYRVELVLEETFMNVATHAFPDGMAHPFQIELHVGQDAISLHVRDNGVAFDPLQRAAAPLPESIDAAQPGGLGLHLIRRYASFVHYERVAGMNHLTVSISRHHP